MGAGSCQPLAKRKGVPCWEERVSCGEKQVRADSIRLGVDVKRVAMEGCKDALFLWMVCTAGLQSHSGLLVDPIWLPFERNKRKYRIRSQEKELLSAY